MSRYDLKKDAVFRFSSLLLFLFTVDDREVFLCSGFAFILAMDHYYMPRIPEHTSLSTNEVEDDNDVSSVSDISGEDHLNRRLVNDTLVTR